MIYVCIHVYIHMCLYMSIKYVCVCNYKNLKMAMHLKDIKEGGVQKFICRVKMEGWHCYIFYNKYNIYFMYIYFICILKFRNMFSCTPYSPPILYLPQQPTSACSLAHYQNQYILKSTDNCNSSGTALSYLCVIISYNISQSSQQNKNCTSISQKNLKYQDWV